MGEWDCDGASRNARLPSEPAWSTAGKGECREGALPGPFRPTVHQHSEQQLNLSCLSCHLLNRSPKHLRLSESAEHCV